MRLTPLLVLLLACGADGPGKEEDCPLDDDPSLELGVGADRFNTLEEADGEAVLIHGAQGGYHLELGLRATGLDYNDLASAVLTGSVGGVELANNSAWVQFRCNPDTQTADAVNVRLIYDADPVDLDGQDTEVLAEVTDANGDLFSAQTTLRIIDPLLR